MKIPDNSRSLNASGWSIYQPMDTRVAVGTRNSGESEVAMHHGPFVDLMSALEITPTDESLGNQNVIVMIDGLGKQHVIMSWSGDNGWERESHVPEEYAPFQACYQGNSFLRGSDLIRMTEIAATRYAHSLDDITIREVEHYLTGTQNMTVIGDVIIKYMDGQWYIRDGVM